MPPRIAPRAQAAGPFSCRTTHRFSFDIGECSSILTRSPIAQALASS
jgi:hypothetical protein